MFTSLGACGCSMMPGGGPGPTKSPAPPRPTAVDQSGQAEPLPTVLPHKPVIKAHGIIKSVDRNKQGVSIQHEANAELREKTGVTHYVVNSPGVLSDVQAGDEVDYDVEKQSNGKVVVTGMVQMGR